MTNSDPRSRREAELAHVLVQATIEMVDVVDVAIVNYVEMLESIMNADYTWESDRAHDLRALRALLSRVVFDQVTNRARAVMEYDRNN